MITQTPFSEYAVEQLQAAAAAVRADLQQAEARGLTLRDLYEPWDMPPELVETEAANTPAVRVYDHRPFTLAICNSGVRDLSLQNKPFESFEQFAQSLAKPKVIKDKLSAPYFMRGAHGEVAQRYDENIVDAQIVLLDADKRWDKGKVVQGAPPVDEAVAALNDMGYNYVLWTTWSHDADAGFHRYRVALEVDRAMTREEVPLSVSYCLDQLKKRGVDLARAKESDVWAQAWFFPAAPKERLAMYAHTADCSGSPLRVSLMGTAERIRATTSGLAKRHVLGMDKPPLADIEALTSKILTGGDFHQATRDLAASCTAQGMSPRAVLGMLQGLMNQSRHKGTARWGERYDDLENLVASAVEKYAKDAPMNRAKAEGEARPDEEVAKTIARMLKPTRMRLPLPLDDYPEPIADFCRELARWGQVDPAMAAGHVLGVLSAAVKNQAVVEELPGHTVSLTTVVITAAQSGERKSLVHRKLTEPLDAVEEELGKLYEQECNQWKAREDARKREIKTLDQEYRRSTTPDERKPKIKAELEVLESKEEEPPPRRQFYIDDATPEQYVRDLYANGGALSILSAEGRGFCQTLLGHYSDDKARDAVYLQAYSGDVIKYSRVSGKDRQHTEIVIRHPVGSIAVLVQDDIVDRILGHKAVNSSGFVARVLFVRPGVRAGSRFEDEEKRPMGKDLVAAYDKLLRNLTSHRAADAGALKIRLDEDAAEYRRELNNSLERRMADGEDLEHFRPLASKAVTKVAKLAGLFTLVEACREQKLHTVHIGANKTSELVVDGETWLAAQSVANWLMHETLAAQAEHDPDEYDEAEGAVLRWMLDKRKGEALTLRTIYSGGPACVREKKKAQEVMQQLVSSGACCCTKEAGKELYTAE